jgi:alcohol dehydrogenase
MLPHVVRFNAADPASATLYADLARTAGVCTNAKTSDEAVDTLLVRLHALLDLARIGDLLARHGVTTAVADRLAVEAAQQWTAQFNPRPLTVADFRSLFVQAIGTRT